MNELGLAMADDRREKKVVYIERVAERKRVYRIKKKKTI